jgi:hypothetical protein
LLDDAISDFQKNNTGLKPGADDLMFNGNITKWKQVAYALKARYYLHLTKRTGSLAFNPAQEALNAVTNAISSSANDLVLNYGYSASEQNPFYSYCRLDYIVPNSSFTSLLVSLGDPRRSYYYKMLYGVASLSNSYFTSPTSPVHLITYHELKFIEAEARLRLNNTDPLAQAALEAGVRASIAKVSGGLVSEAVTNQYVTNNTVLTGNFNTDLQIIIRQKYIALFTSIESWTDYRRTGFPALTPTAGGDHNQNPGGGIPRRLPYPQTERLYNPNVPNPLPNLQDRFWWDAN